MVLALARGPRQKRRGVAGETWGWISHSTNRRCKQPSPPPSSHLNLFLGFQDSPGGVGGCSGEGKEAGNIPPSCLIRGQSSAAEEDRGSNFTPFPWQPTATRSYQSTPIAWPSEIYFPRVRNGWGWGGRKSRKTGNSGRAPVQSICWCQHYDRVKFQKK